MSNAASSPTPTTSRNILKLRYRFLFAALAGLLTYPLFPRLGVWVLVFPIVALLYLAVKGLKFWRATAVGFVGGIFFYVSHIYWISQYLGPEPLIALAALQAFFFALGLGLAGWASIRLDSLLSGRKAIFAQSLLFAMIWTAREHISTHYPYGGFPWSRLAMSQSDSILGNWVFWGGMPLLSFVIALATVLVLEFLHIESRRVGALAALGVAVALVVPAGLAPLTNNAEKGSITIASVQGNANAGLFSNNDPGTFLNHHLEAARTFLASKKDFDVMVWPENAVDVDVLHNAGERALMTDFVNNEVKKPLIFGTVTFRDGKLYNSSILWLPKAENVDWYDKKRPVPFAEYVPDRAFWEKISPLVNLIQVGYSFGERDGNFEVEKGNLGTLICFEIAVDEITRTLVRDGAQLILSQTNNADFGHSDEAFQQLAIAKLRAIESGRALVNVSTVGPSAVFLPTGQQLAYVEPFTPGSMLTTVPLRASKTPAYFFSQPFDLANLALVGALTAFLAAAPILRRRRELS